MTLYKCPYMFRSYVRLCGLTELQKLDTRWIHGSGVATTEYTNVLLFKQVSNFHLAPTNTSLCTE